MKMLGPACEKGLSPACEFLFVAKTDLIILISQLEMTNK